MKTLFVTVFVLIVGLIMPVDDAFAGRRLGGGTSSGMQRNISTPATKPNSTNQSTAPSQPTAAQTGKRSWLGPVAGIAAALGLTALMAHLGLGEEMASFLMLMLLLSVGFMAFRWFMARNQKNPQSMAYAAGNPAQARPNPIESFESSAVSSSSVASPLPSDIDAQAFARQAKVNFLRLQAANDKADLADIREFTTPEMYAEISLHIQERGSEPQQTEVVNVEAEILDFAEEGDRQILSVRFHGLIREDDALMAKPFDEAWHLVRPKDLSRHWLIAGIQQLGG